MSDRPHTLDVDGYPVLSLDEVHRLSYCFPEGIEPPTLFTAWAGGQDVDAHALEALLDGEVRRATADSDEAQELILVALRRLRNHPAFKE